MSRMKYAVVWVGDGVRLHLGLCSSGPPALYALQAFDGGKYGRQEWCRVDGTARRTLSEIVRDFGHIPGITALTGLLPDQAALASKSYWRYLAEESEELAVFFEFEAANAREYRELEQAAILERGLCDV